MGQVLENFAERWPSEVVHRGGETLVAAEVALELLDEARRQRIQSSGLEGFLIDGEAVYPALSRIADFSALSTQSADLRAASYWQDHGQVTPTSKRIRCTMGPGDVTCWP